MKLVELTQEQVDQIRILSGLGFGLDKIAANLGIGPATLHRLKRRDSRILEAIVLGRNAAQATVARSLFQAAREGSISACIWLEKSRFGFNDELNLATCLNYLVSMNILPASLCEELLQLHEEVEADYEAKMARLFETYAARLKRERLGD